MATATGRSTSAPRCPTAPHTVRAVATDGDDGNTATDGGTFTVDTETEVAIVAPAEGATVGGPRPTISSSAEAGASVVVSVDGTEIGTVVAGADGTWSVRVTFDLTDGRPRRERDGDRRGRGTPRRTRSTSRSAGSTPTATASSTPRVPVDAVPRHRHGRQPGLRRSGRRRRRDPDRGRVPGRDELPRQRQRHDPGLPRSGRRRRRHPHAGRRFRIA
ncbi:MAG: hypothetical protein H6720_29345 [Sandaracinus sp.]|nr:hypothetical protein [Sandaracinus sp.]